VGESATAIGEVLSMLVHIVNLARIIVGGPLGDLLAGIKRVVNPRALPLATPNLTMTHSNLGRDASTAGGLVLGIEQAFDADRLQSLLERRARALRFARQNRAQSAHNVRSLPSAVELDLVVNR
jgi:predicted NBD/HSP70 family sugar kinase